MVEYKVYISPVQNGGYASEIEISAEIIETGVGTMKKSIDAGDFDIGIFTYGDLTLKAVNENGYLNDNDPRSIFQYGRDRAKVRIVYSKNEVESTVFTGIINEEATKQDLDDESLVLKVLSQDSVLRKTYVAGGLIANGDLCSTAIKSILNQSTITKVLTYSASNINPDYDFTIDDASSLGNKSVREVLNSLLLASNSVLLIDSSNNMIVRSRSAYTNNFLFLKGPYVKNNDTNILSARNYNTGLHRMFNSVLVNNTEYVQSAYVSDYGFRQKEITLAYITNPDTIAEIGRRLSNEFKFSKQEVELEVSTDEVIGHDLLDIVSVDYPLRIEPYDKFLPIVGGTNIGDTQAKLPYSYGNLSIHPNTAFKIIEVAERPSSKTTVLKLRQVGSGPGDGVFGEVASSLVGYAIIGESLVVGGGDTCATWNPSSLGAALIDCTKIA